MTKTSQKRRMQHNKLILPKHVYFIGCLLLKVDAMLQKPKRTQTPHRVEALPRTDSNRSPVSPAPSSPASSLHSELSILNKPGARIRTQNPPDIYCEHSALDFYTVLMCPTPTKTKKASESPVKVKTKHKTDGSP